MSKISAVCLFCGSAHGKDPAHAAAAARFGRLLAARGVRLVYGGGSIGLMGVAARAALEAGGEVIGIIPQDLVDRELALREVSELIVVDGMHTRKQIMFERSEAIVVLPGGIGTLEETVEMITWMQLGLHRKDIVMIDPNGYWAPLHALMEHMIDGGFAGPELAGYVTVVNSPEAALEALNISG